MNKRDAEKRKRQREQTKGPNHVHNSEHGHEEIANSTRDGKGLLFFAIQPISQHGLEISTCWIQHYTQSPIDIQGIFKSLRHWY